ncbi:MAG: hydroxymethylbilane synthase [Lachnospiraceae bacterium]|nr:hydroxymethylbilane synthase [Lachnospiraceae bacterium]
MKKIILATRGSALALAQSNIVASELEALGATVELKIVKTGGDKDTKSPLRIIGGNGLFVKEIEKKLLTKEADIAVHSGKDLPYNLAEGLMIGATPKAADSRDCLIFKKGCMDKDNLVIGTGSPRREKQCKKFYPNAIYKEIRGNIDTRLRKCKEGEYDAIFLAKAGIDRLGLDLSDFDVKTFDVCDIVPAACQGILAVECRNDDKEIIELLDKISDTKTRFRFELERKFFCDNQVDCSMAVGAYAEIYDEKYDLYTLLEDNYDKKCLKKGLVVLVGAGCGKGLITTRGLDFLKKAEVVVYDDLINIELLNEVNEDAKLIYVGKRMNSHSMKQELINDILIDEAMKGKRVVRLKGGDGFLFGRGGEELLALKRRGITCDIVPGVSSAIAVPEHVGIPVTHRGVASSVTIITGHTNNSKTENYAALAKLEGTLVFLMGLHAALEISTKLIENGKSENTPVSIISEGYRSNEQRINGSLKTLPLIAQKATTPAIIVIGDVASYELCNRENKALSNISVTVIGTEYFSNKLGALLEEKGAFVNRVKTITLDENILNIPDSFEKYTWIVFTSGNGIRIFFKGLLEKKLDIRMLSNMKFACIGAGTKKALAEYGIIADFVPSDYTAKVLGRELAKLLVPTDKVLIMRAENGSKLLNEELDKMKIVYDDRSIYDTVCVTQRIENQGKTKSDYIVFGSRNGALAYLEMYGEINNQKIVCIGEETGSVFEGRDIQVPKVHTAEAIVELIMEDVFNEKV